MARSARRLTLAAHTWDRQIPDILAAAGLPTLEQREPR
jgi:hypothetical protein